VSEFNVGDRVRVQNWPVEPNPANDLNGREGTIRGLDVYYNVELDNPPPWPLRDGLVRCLAEELEKL
jgi:hypothetical protein